MERTASLNEYLASIIEGSDDAIITKNLDGIIQTWNRGAEQLFGYTAEEAKGQPIVMLIPNDRLREEDDIMARLRRGERIQHFETTRRRKDGSLVPLSLTISPVRNSQGEVIGASSIARDITAQIKAAERQQLLVAEMRHRVSNCFAVAGSLISVTAREVETSKELARVMRDRLMALSSAHRLAVADPSGTTTSPTSLEQLVNSVVKPLAAGQSVTLNIDKICVAPEALTSLAMILYEFGTNAAKYGAFSQHDGKLEVCAKRVGDRLVIEWNETCQIAPVDAENTGFGTSLCQDVARSSLGGTITREFEPTGLRAVIDLELARLEA
ncbi:PAS domain S-box protein [Sulfitobacter sp. S0837]|uniref:PAS domain S-box protein n=1 Tax=Sulfitobacter maritimus TaxID=2741719 RepID=UPI0015815EF5|nr:PAS domain S-box protein [Sulfitobacter maritimus]NUH65278.1 PAS domain S-box protein [Sulfitobacter maritimus]